MAIRAWYLDGLYRAVWDSDTDRAVPPPGLCYLAQFPEDFHLFIITKYQKATFLRHVKTLPWLSVHYEQKEPSYSYRYPNEPAKLLTFILKIDKERL